jgi:FtsZ-interacting cell division protein ZipA
MLPILTVVGLVVTVVLTLAAVWYASRRLRQLEAKLKLGNGLTATHIKDMDKVVADISEVKQGLHSLAHEMGLKFVSPERMQHQTAQRLKPPVEQPRAAPQPSHKQPSQQEATKSPSQQEATKSPSQQEATTPSQQEATKSPSQQEATIQSQQEATKSPSQKEATITSQQEATKSPSQQEAKIQSPPDATKSPSQQPPSARKGKGKGKGKSTILMNLFPEFVGPITIPTETTTSSTHVPRVEEMGEDTECEGGMCTINSK